MHRTSLALALLLAVLSFGLVVPLPLAAGEAPPPLATQNGDVNGDNLLDVSDAIYLLAFQFLGGPPPVGFNCNPDVPPPPPLATARGASRLQDIFGRAIVSARGNHFVMDSVPPVGGPNEEMNPLDALLGAFATCGIFIAEAVAREEGIPLGAASAVVEADFDPSGLAGAPNDPRLQEFRVHLELPGASPEEIASIVESFRTRCPIYTTLIRSADIEVTVNDEPIGPPLEGLATARASAKLSKDCGRAIVSARGNHFVVDSVPPVMGPNEERNPLDLLLGALLTCGTFLYERVAVDEGMNLTDLKVEAEADFLPAGVAPGSDVSPRIQEFRLHFRLTGVDEAQEAILRESFTRRCPVYTTLVRSAPVVITAETSGS